MTASRKPEPPSAAIWTSTTARDRIRALTPARPIRLISATTNPRRGPREFFAAVVLSSLRPGCPPPAGSGFFRLRPPPGGGRVNFSPPLSCRHYGRATPSLRDDKTTATPY